MEQNVITPIEILADRLKLLLLRVTRAFVLGGADECPDAAEVRRTLELLQHELRCMREQELSPVDDAATPGLDTVPTVVENADEYLEQGGAVTFTLQPILYVRMRCARCFDSSR